MADAPVTEAPPEVRTRFAPAPSGSIHVGNARTALFSWLYARRNGGRFVLRIEDTDRKRSTDEGMAVVLDSLRWLGLEWDEGPEVGGPFAPYRQSERLQSYRDAVDALVASGRAYPCYCTPEELEDRNAAARARGETPGYDGRCRTLSADERAAFEAEGRAKAFRFAMSGNDVTVPDLIHGDTHFAGQDLRDFVLLRNDGTPTYLLAAPVDDVAMGLTHVIRGDDLLPSTARQIELIEALGARPPRYGHLPLIVGPNQQPLSKRHGSVSVEWFRDEGYLPEALVNYLALLGWSFDAETTFFTLDELVGKFDLGRVSHNPAAFDRDKLRWMNGHYIRESPDERLAVLLHERLETDGVEADQAVVAAAVPLVKERMHTIREGADYLRFLFVERVEPDEKAAKLLGPDQADLLREAASRLEAVEDWTTPEIESVLRALQQERGLSPRHAFQPIRGAVTGTLVSPPLFESLALLGKARTLARLRAAAESASS